MQTGDINSIQAGIMRQLFWKDGLRFAEINVDSVSSDQFSYHLRQMIKYGLIEKSIDNIYSLSRIGKSRAIMLYPNKNGYIEQGFLAVRIVLSKVENGKTYYLLRKRSVVPYRGTYSTPGDKIFFGEDVSETAKRAMLQHTGLTCEVKLAGITHTKDKYLGSIVQDKYFFVFVATNPKGRLLLSSRTGHNEWLTYEQLENSGLSIHGGLEIIKMAINTKLTFQEAELTVDAY
jgi:ADP-ribose pyrophosphatase YjhB (NUDIX family)